MPSFVQSARLGGGTAIGQILVVASTPIITRLYRPADLGLLGLFISFVNPASMAVALRYELAIVSAKSDEEADILLTACVGLIGSLSGFGGMLMAAFISWNILSYGQLPVSSAVMATLAIAATATFTTLRYWHVRRSGFGAIGRSLIWQAAGRSFISVSLGIYGVGWAGLMAAEVIGRSFGIVELARGAARNVRQTISRISLEHFKRVTKEYWRYPALVLPSSLADNLAVTLPLPLIAWAFGSGDAGRFLLVSQVGSLPASLVGASVADVFHATIAQIVTNEPEKLPSTLKNWAVALTFTSLAIYVPIAMISPFVFGPVFGSQWREAGILMTLQSPLLAAGLAVGTLSRILLVTNRQQSKLAIDLSRLLIPVAAFVGGRQLKFSFLTCTIVFAALGTVAYLAYFVVLMHAARLSALGAPSSVVSDPNPPR